MRHKPHGPRNRDIRSERVYKPGGILLEGEEPQGSGKEEGSIDAGVSGQEGAKRGMSVPFHLSDLCTPLAVGGVEGKTTLIRREDRVSFQISTLKSNPSVARAINIRLLPILARVERLDPNQRQGTLVSCPSRHKTAQFGSEQEALEGALSTRTRKQERFVFSYDDIVSGPEKAKVCGVLYQEQQL